MHLQLVQAQAQVQVPSLTGGATTSLFPAIEAWLDADTDRMHAFERITRPRNRTAARYRSLFDFLLCEVVPQYKPLCLAFYETDAPSLRTIAGPRTLKVLEARLLLFLTLAYEAYVQHRQLSWRQAVGIVDTLLRAA